MPTEAPYGTWTSPITADLIAKEAISFEDLIVDPITSTVYHAEKRPSEGGRNVIVKTESDTPVYGADWNARTGVEEYGGSCSLVHNGVVYFSNLNDGRIYKIEGSGSPVAVTPENGNHRFADFAIHPTRPELIVSILEDHTKPAPADVITTLVVVNVNKQTVSPLVAGADFYSSAAFNGDGTRLAWVQWFHPDMPWEGAQVLVADVVLSDDGLTQTNARVVAGEKLTVSAAQPRFIGKDTLLFTCDKSGFQNPWCVKLGSGCSAEAQPVLPTAVQQDFGEPAWFLGDSCYAILDDATAVFTALKDGRSRLYTLTLADGALKELNNPYVHITRVRRRSSNEIVFLGDKTDEASAIVLCTLPSSAGDPTYKTLKTASVVSLPKTLFSTPQPKTFVAPQASGGPLYAVFYPPNNPDFVGPDGEKPPCVVSVHGGPTSMAMQGLNLRAQYFTTRGWAWMDVNYGGSSGYGRQYISRLASNWGVVDIEDSIASVLQLAAPPHALVDPARAVITGGSAGGFTTLAALCASPGSSTSPVPGAFAAGTSCYGISDLNKLAEDTHKFESHYMEKLMGGTPSQVPQVYHDRSPLFNANKIKSPLLILQGELDKVVPPSQAEEMVKVIKANGGRVEYTLYKGEGHGWRKAETIINALETEIAFYNDVFGLKR